MLITAFLFWWYGQGWVQQLGAARATMVNTFDAFSIDLLAKSLFSPFRQISAGKTQGPLKVVLQAWLDRLVSRVIGAMLRTTIIFVGLISLVVMLFVSVLRVLLWPVLPALPVVFFLLMLTGWIPWRG